MDIVSAAVLCSQGAATAPAAAGAALAPMAVSLPTHQQHVHEQQVASFCNSAPQPNASKASVPLASEAPVKARLMHPISAPADGAPSVRPMEDDPAVLLHRRLSLISIQHAPAPELTPVAEESDEEAEETAVRSNTQEAAASRSYTPGVVSAASKHHHHHHGHQALQSKLAVEALGVLRANDLGGYTIPATGLYPYQWNWDSALVAMGWSTVDESRAWEELDKLFSAQWGDGMVPHIVFHKASPSYFPGPEIWGYADKPMKSTGITQPPIAATAVRRILENQLSCGSVKSGEGVDDWDCRPVLLLGGGLEAGSDVETGSTCSTSYCRSPHSRTGDSEDGQLDSESWARAAELFPKLMSYHRWFYAARDPESKGLVATLHPWETGMDNSPAWDVPLANVPVDDIPPYTRRDLGHVDAAMRPHQSEYDRYLTLLYRFRAADYDPEKLYWLSPFRVTDVCTNSLLHRANLDLRWLAVQLNHLDCVAEIDGWLARSQASFDTLWDEEAGIFKSKDQLTGELLGSATSGGFLPLFARTASPEQAARLAETLTSWLDAVKYGVPSLDPLDPRFEGLRYWRGPVWAIVNYMVVDGLTHYGYMELASRIESDTLGLVQTAGLYEYYDPVTGRGAGGNNFSWTAAMVLSWLEKGNGAPEAPVGSDVGSVARSFSGQSDEFPLAGALTT